MANVLNKMIIFIYIVIVSSSVVFPSDFCFLLLLDNYDHYVTILIIVCFENIEGYVSASVSNRIRGENLFF